MHDPIKFYVVHIPSNRIVRVYSDPVTLSSFFLGKPISGYCIIASNSKQHHLVPVDSDVGKIAIYADSIRTIAFNSDLLKRS